MKTRSTLKDVAFAAGVSPTTVSLYLNGSHQVCSDETATRIRQAVVDLHYPRGLKALKLLEAAVPPASIPQSEESELLPPSHELDSGIQSRAKQSLGTARKLRTIGIALPSSSSVNATELSHPGMQHFANQIWSGASEIAEWEEFRLLSFPRSLSTRRSIDAFVDGSISGLVLEAGFQDPRLPEIIRAGLPVVVVNRFLDIPDGCGTVYPMMRDAVDVAMNFLWEKGHRRIAYYGGPGLRSREMINVSPGADSINISWTPSDFATLTEEYFQVFMRQHQSISADLSYREARWDGVHADTILERWLSLTDPPTAVFCYSDALALSLWLAVEKRGMSVPADLSIMGLGDAPAAYRQNRPLTTIALPGVEVGRQAMRFVLRMMEGIPPSQCRLAIPLTESAIIDRGSVTSH